MTNFIAPHIARSIAPDYLKLIILPTEKCNLRCTYCYEDFAIGRMLPEVTRGVKNLISRRGRDLRTLHLSWFGGEPLLAPREIIEICKHAQEVARENPGMEFQSSMTTNGVLLDIPMATQMTEIGVQSYQISLDGPEELHNTSRVTVNGGGTYQAIWSNLIKMHETDLQFIANLRVHYRPENWQALFPLLDDIKENFGGDYRFRVVFNPIVRMGGKNDDKITKITRKDKEDIAAQLYARVGQNTMEGPAAEATEGMHAVCYAATANSLVIRSNGSVNKCTVALNDDRNDVGRINEDGTFTLHRDKYLPWMKGLETQDPFALSCPYASHIKQTPVNANSARVISIQAV